MRNKFASFEDWNDSALDIYNDYDNAKAVLEDRTLIVLADHNEIEIL